MIEHNKSNPWLGLESYQEGEVLYGRDDDIRDLTQSVLNDIDTLLYGKSGIGKSSILNAGVIPASRRHNFLPILVRFSHKESHSYLFQIHEAIAAAMLPDSKDDAGDGPEERKKRDEKLAKRIKEVVERKDGEEESVYEYFHRHTFHDENGERVKLLIIFDQFEEIFTLQADESKKKKFFADLADFLNGVMPSYLQNLSVAQHEVQDEIDISQNDNLDDMLADIDLGINNELPEYVNDNEIHLVFTIREDFLSEFEYYTASIPSLKHNRYGLRPINDEQASQIILRPQPGLIKEDVAKLIIEKVTGRTDFELDGIPEIEVDSAVLSLYLNRLYEAKTGEKITADLVEQKGGEIISDFYKDAISEISESSIEYLEDMLLNGQGRRDNITVYDAINDGGLTQEELDILCNKKKILRQFNYAGDLRIEYVHDILCPVVKAHKDERLLARHHEEERLRQEEEKNKILLQEKQKREKIERRNRKRLFFISTFIIILVAVFLGYLWYYEWEYETYYAEFERVNGWPKGVGDPLTPEQRNHTPLYYKLSHKGRLNHDTDVKVMSSNDALPPLPRISGFSNTENKADMKGAAFNALLSKIAYLHFVEGENGKIDKEIALDEDKNPLFIINYFHLPNGKESWAQFVTPTGQALQIRDNGIDRLKISWFSNEKEGSERNAANNGRIETISFFDASNVGHPLVGSIGGYSMKFDSTLTTTRYFMDEYGRPTQTPYNVVATTVSNDTTHISYFKALSLEDASLRPAPGPKGFPREMKVGNETYFYTNADPNQVATLSTVRDGKGNILEEKFIGLVPKSQPALVRYSYSPRLGYMTSIEKFDENLAPFSTPEDSIFKKQWDYSSNGELVLEEHWKVPNEKVYSHKISDRGNVKIDELFDKDKDIYLTRIDSITPESTITSFFGPNHSPATALFSLINGSMAYHKIIISENDSVKTSKFYTLDSEGKIIPSPTVFDDYGMVQSCFAREDGFDSDGNPVYYKILDENGKIIKSMMYYLQNGQPVARGAMGIEGYGHPVRCPNWEEEGFAYYKIYYSTDLNDNYVNIISVDEWENPGIFYDPSRHSYYTISYKDYQNSKLINQDKDTTYVLNSYKQQSLDAAKNISNTSMPYLHILSKESPLYVAGMRDGDRIVQLGRWSTGMSESLLAQEWVNMTKKPTTVSVLRPSTLTYEKLSWNLQRTRPDLEEYHIYKLTYPELKALNNFTSSINGN